ncbi:MAG: SGNH/GDSL hydrolase family protein [Planctomycetota bacterium]|jgi:hypothetical protein
MSAPGRFTGRARLATVALSLALTTCAAEIALRSAPQARPDYLVYVGELPDRESMVFERDPLVGWRMRRTWSHQTDEFDVTYHADDEGFRHDPEARPRADKLLVLAGDSQTWGTGVRYRETYGALLAERLGGWKCANVAQPGFGLDQIWLSVRHQALPRRPDLIVVGLFEQEFRRSLSAYRRDLGFNKPTFVLEDGALRRRTAADTPGLVRRWLDRHSRVWSLARRALRRQYARRAWPLSEALLEALRRDCAAAGVPVVFLRIPGGGDHTAAALDRYLRGAGAAYVDPDAVAPDGPGPLRVARDGHLNAAGHRWMAQALATWISRHRPVGRSR